MFICVIQAYYSEGNLRITKTNERSRFRMLVKIITTSPISMKFSIWMVMALWIMRKGTGYFLPWWTTYTRAGPRVYAFLWNGANELSMRPWLTRPIRTETWISHDQKLVLSYIKTILKYKIDFFK